MIATIYKPVDPGGRRSLTRVDELGWELGTVFATTSSRRRERHSTQPTNGQSLRGVGNDATIKPVRNLYTYFGHATLGGPT